MNEEDLIYIFLSKNVNSDSIVTFCPGHFQIYFCPDQNPSLVLHYKLCGLKQPPSPYPLPLPNIDFFF